jgi:hypothetical protein
MFCSVWRRHEFYRLLELARVVVEPSMEDIELESFAQLGDGEYFDEVVELVKAIFDPISEMQPECGETTELSFATTYSLAFEPPDLISESKWVGPIYRWPSSTMGSNDHFRSPFFDHLMKWLAEYFFVLIDYPSYDHYPFDPGKLVHTILGSAIDVSTYCHR